jgi:hypothetical protein
MKEKDYIEEIISNNLEELNDNEPLKGHFERFGAKLKQSKKKTVKFSTVWKVAAAVIFVLLIANQAHMYLSPGKNATILSSLNNKPTTLSSVSQEYGEVEFYYTNAINVGLNNWNSMIEQGVVSEEEQQMMETELNEFEDRFRMLQNDLETNPNDERVINAMIEYYQTKLSLINMIIEKLQEVKQKNNAENEKEL